MYLMRIPTPEGSDYINPRLVSRIALNHNGNAVIETTERSSDGWNQSVIQNRTVSAFTSCDEAYRYLRDERNCQPAVGRVLAERAREGASIVNLPAVGDRFAPQDDPIPPAEAENFHASFRDRAAEMEGY